MILYSTQLLMVLAFLLLTLMLGLYYTKKTITLREYAVGNKQFQTTTLVFTVLGTVFGVGSLISNVLYVHFYGIVCIFYICGVYIRHYIISLLVLRMGPFMRHLSVAETIGSVYGRCPRVLTALFAIGLSIGVVAIQINVMASAISMYMDSIDPRIMTVAATLILIAYAIFGGVRAITITDVLQFITFMIITALLIKFVFIKTGKSFLEVVWILKKEDKFQFSNLFQFDSKSLKVIFDGLWYIFVLNPSVIQRVYMSSSVIQAYKVFLRVTLCIVITMGCIMSIGLIVFVWNPTLPVKDIWPYILDHMSPAYKGVYMVGLLGLAMSTADSNLHTAAIMVSHDIVESIRGVKVGSCIYQIRLAKVTVLILGLLAMVITVYFPDLFELGNAIYCHVFMLFSITTVPPFVLAVFGFRGSARTALIGMAIGVLAYLTKCDKIISLAANGLAMMAAHYLLRQPADKGWIGSNAQQKRMQQLIRIYKKYKTRIDLE